MSEGQSGEERPSRELTNQRNTLLKEQGGVHKEVAAHNNPLVSLQRENFDKVEKQLEETQANVSRDKPIEGLMASMAQKKELREDKQDLLEALQENAERQLLAQSKNTEGTTENQIEEETQKEVEALPENVQDARKRIEALPVQVPPSEKIEQSRFCGPPWAVIGGMRMTRGCLESNPYAVTHRLQ